MPAVRLLPPDRFFDRATWSALTRASPWRCVWLVAHSWIVSLALVGLATWTQNPAAWLLAIVFLGGRQLGLAILMHDAAHGALHPNRKIKIGSAHVRTPVTNAQLVCRPLLEKKKESQL